MNHSKIKFIKAMTVFLIFVMFQFIIILSWEVYKMYTLPNLIILLFAFVLYTDYRFLKIKEKEYNALFYAQNHNNVEVVTEEAIKHLPLIVQKWLKLSGVIDKEYVCAVHLKQKGKMRTKPNAAWMPFVASQYFNIVNTSFVWDAKVKMIPYINLYGLDKLINGKGAMLIKLLGLIPIVNERENYQINSGAMIRYLAEVCWFPSAALHDSISWESISATSAKATFTIKEVSVSGIFNFSEAGEIISFESERFYGGTKNASLEKWCIEMITYKEFNKVKIPNKCNVIWKLKEGDFHWLIVEIIAIDYTTAKMY